MFYVRHKTFPSEGWTRSGVTFGFTLVELIVVITILAILGTIAFISLQGFARDARDSQRLSDVGIIERGLNIYKTGNNKIPEPDQAVTMTASGAIMSYQGNIGSGVLYTLQQAGKILDPLLDEMYVYSANQNRTKYQILVYMENVESTLSHNSLFTETHAASREDLHLKSFGDQVGIVTDSVSKQAISIPVDIFNTTNEYMVTISHGNSVTGSGEIIANTLGIINSQLAQSNENIIGYWDFTDTNNFLNDYSATGNNLTSSGVTQETIGAKFKRSVQTQYIGSPYTLGDDFSIIVKFKPTGRAHGYDCHNTNLLSQRTQYCSNVKWGLNYTYHGWAASHDQKVSFVYGNGAPSGWIATLSNNQYFINSDIFVIMVKRGDIGELYVNGELDKTFPITNFQNNTIPLNIGGAGHSFFDGYISKASILNTALIEDEIDFIFRNY